MFLLSEDTIRAFQAMTYPEAYTLFKKNLHEEGLNLSIVAERIGWTGSKLEKKLTPSHQWQVSIHELILIGRHSGILTLLHWAVAQTLDDGSCRETVTGLTPSYALRLMSYRDRCISNLTCLLANSTSNEPYSRIEAGIIQDAVHKVVRADLQFLEHLSPILAVEGGVNLAVPFEDLQAERIAQGRQGGLLRQWIRRFFKRGE